MRRSRSQLVRRTRHWRGLASGAGIGLGAGWLADTANAWLIQADALLQGGNGAGVLAGLALLTGFFFETSPPRSGSKGRQKDRLH